MKSFLILRTVKSVKIINVGPWLPNHPRMNQHIGDQWGLAPPPRGPIGPNPFEAALDQGHFIPNPTEMELRIMNERSG